MRTNYVILAISLFFAFNHAVYAGTELARCTGTSQHASESFDVSITIAGDALWIAPTDTTDPRQGLQLWVPYVSPYVLSDSADLLSINNTFRKLGFKMYQQLLKIDFKTGEGLARYYDRRLPSLDRRQEIRLSNCVRLYG